MIPHHADYRESETSATCRSCIHLVMLPKKTLGGISRIAPFCRKWRENVPSYSTDICKVYTPQEDAAA